MSSATLHHGSGQPKGSGVSTRRNVAIAAVITALGGLLFGYDTGVVSGALLFLKNDFGGLSSFQQELVTSLLLVGAAAGALGAGRVADAIGRRKTIIITASVFIVGVLLAALAPVYPVLLLARIVIGLAVGSSSMVVPLYIGDRPAAASRRAGQLQPAGDHPGHPGLLPCRLRPSRPQELAVDVRTRGDPGRDPAGRDAAAEGEPALAGAPGSRRRGP